MNIKKGFTLTEILVAIGIVAAIAAVALPNFTTARNKAAGAQAVAYLRTIATAEKMYYAKWKTYLGSLGSAAAIQAGLGADVRARNYTFSVAAPSATTFTATATTTGGALTINQDGAFTATGNQGAYRPTS